jgi:hypothetical protein
MALFPERAIPGIAARLAYLTRANTSHFIAISVEQHRYGVDVEVGEGVVLIAGLADAADTSGMASSRF